MRVIDRALVDQVWREIIAYPPDRAESEARAFLDRQPHVAEFSHTTTAAFDPAVQQAAFGLCVLLFKILEASLGAPFPAVSDERIRAAQETMTERLAAPEGSNPGAALRSLEAAGHAGLIAHILSVFYGGDAEASAYDAEVRLTLGLLLLTLTEVVELGEVEA